MPAKIGVLIAMLSSLMSMQAGAADSAASCRTEWFTEARFGMFIHWGLYSAAEGQWKGETLRHANNYAEWIMYRNQITPAEYIGLLERFDWEAIDPEQWVLLAKRAGMKYVVFTAKHHDGFALWKSAADDYCLGRAGGPERDIVAELALACRKHGLKLGLYYSHWIDWAHPYGWKHDMEIAPITAAQYDEYWQEKVIPQIRELLSDYGDIAMLWFDMWINHSQTIVSREQLVQLKALIRELQPDCLINSRLGLSIEEDPDVDFHTMDDNQLGSRRLDYAWQSPATVAHSWGYHAADKSWKSTSRLLQDLIGNVSLNGNYLLNIGPRADGGVPYEIEQRLEQMGEWLWNNGESVYGATACGLDPQAHDWGRITAKSDESGYRLFLHLFKWPQSGVLYLSGVKSAPTRVYALADRERRPLEFSHNGAATSIRLPARRIDPYISVLVAEYPRQPEMETGMIFKNIEGGYSLTPDNRLSSEGDFNLSGPERYGTVPRKAAIQSESTMKWRLFIDQPGKYKLEASYSCQGDPDGGALKLSCGKQGLEHDLQVSGMTVAEPKSNWHVPRYRAHAIGQLDFAQTGYYELELQLSPPRAGELNFQWLWMKAVD